ncbi:MAG: DUF2325 domain-containing protein [Dehalococcoidia bacterium]|nr:DUF2325 domain-containing protein [Dehalococcoidia bacterium]
MIRLRAEEHRYLVAAGGREEALARRIPGSRYVAAAHALQVPRQPGTINALDRLFGPDGWGHPADLALEVVEARTRAYAPAQQEAHVSLQGNELSVECAFGDKELVKLVPGYRWSAPQRKWFLPACPMAAEILHEHFQQLLHLAPEVVAYLELKRRDEETSLERASAAPPADEAPSAEHPDFTGDERIEPNPYRDAADAAPSAALIERLTVAIVALEGAITRLTEKLPDGTTPGDAFEPAIAPPAPVDAVATQGGRPWQDLLALAETDPVEALRRLSPQLQLAGEEGLPALRAITGIASSLAGDHAEALTFLRKAEEHSAVPLDPELRQPARAAYRDSIFALVSASCGPQRPVASIEGLEELMLGELVHNSGFDDAKLAGREALELLSFLMDDAHLRAFDRRLSDHCRLLHLLSVARGGRWMAAERVIEMLHQRELTDDGFALGIVVLANTVFEQPCMDEWLLRWPPEVSDTGFDDLRWIVSTGVPRLRSVGRTIAAEAALAMLGLISAAPVDVAHMDERRELVRFIPPGASARRYAEFLAGYQLAAAGHKRVAQDFPGYLQILAQSPLRTSAGHLLTVFVSDSGGAASTTRRIAEEVFLDSALNRGVGDPEAEVLELLDMLGESPKGDRLMNELGRAVEEDAFPGASTFSHAHRVTLFERAFRQALKAGHDVDCVEAFDRLTRELVKHGETEALRTMCMGVAPGFKPLQLPVGQALLTLQLEAGEPFEATAEAVLRQCNPADPKDEGTHELKGLALAFPRFREFLEAKEVPPQAIDPGLLAGKRLLVVGGHEWLRKLAMPRFEEWGVKTTWLEPDAAKNGAQALDLASGSTDLIIVNTACISHAASGRVKEQAEKASTRWAYHHSRGVGALLSIARESLADTEPPVVETRVPTKHDRRRKLVR